VIAVPPATKMRSFDLTNSNEVGTEFTGASLTELR